MKQESWRRLFPWRRTEPLPRVRPRLDGQLVVLREKRLSDVQADYAWRTDPELAELDATSPIRLTVEEYTRYYRDELDHPSPWSVRYAIETRDGVHIGNTMYYDIDQSKSRAELGIMIGDRAYWSRGYGTDAVMALVRSIFEDVQLGFVYLHTLSHNARAQKAFRKAGFYNVRDVRRDGRVFLRMEVAREDWLDRFGEADTGDEMPAGVGEAAHDASGEALHQAEVDPALDQPRDAGGRAP